MIVAANGSGDFQRIQEAVDAIPQDNNERCVIHIKKGVYREKLFIDKPFVTLLGESDEETIIVYDDYARKLFPNGEEYGTFNSYTVFIGGNDFTAINITFRNSAGSGDVVGQALAAYVDGDRAKFLNCRFLGHQDTLFTGPLPPWPKIANSFKGPRELNERIPTRQYYENCFIQGDIDFIFGSATAVFNRCEIVANDRNLDVNGYITAASTPEDVKYGYVFIDCTLKSPAAPETVYLGRPWRNYAKTVFINCYMESHIKAVGWDNWSNAENEKTVEYLEYGSRGLGATMDKRAGWSRILTDEEMKEFSIENVLGGEDGWNPKEV